MVKKKGRKKVQKRKEEKSGEARQDGPTEKDDLEMQIGQLKRHLEDCDVWLRQQRGALEEVRNLLESEVNSEGECVSYLKRVLKFETDRRLEVQEKLQNLRDQAECVEKRALGKFTVSEKNREAAKNQFLQQKLELEGKLSLFEELRLKRNSQLVHLKRVDEALEQKILAMREKSREDNMRKVDKLLKNRKEFLEKCRNIRQEWREAFRLRMPVHAKKQLEENVRLREVCDKATEKLLQVQDRNRNLKILQKSLELEEEIQSSAEQDAIKWKTLQKKQLHQLLQARQELQPAQVQTSQQSFQWKDLDALSNSTAQQTLAPGNKLHEKAVCKDAVEQNLNTIVESESEQCRLLDRLDEVAAVLKDQDSYKLSLEKELVQNTDKSGAFMSAILRAGKIFKTRRGKPSQEKQVEMDFDLLQQMRNLLDLQDV